MADVLEVETDTIRMEQTLDELEVDSIVFIRLVVQCETVLSMQFEDEMLLISRFPTVQVFVDYVNQMRQQGLSKREALLETGRDRIRPILMTALTTILALTTMAFDQSAGAVMMKPLALTTIGGLIYATVLTLFIVPVLYDVFHRREAKVHEPQEANAQ